MKPLRFLDRRHKYNAKAVKIDGYRFASKAEGARYSELKILQRSGEITDLTMQPTYPLVVKGIPITKYRADFCYREAGRLVVEETKGFETPDWKIKAKLFKALYPDCIYRVNGKTDDLPRVTAARKVA
jgi:hypothetical protein